ncbi:ATP-binding protein [Accumulibacter sp.]|uniref:ATP-binding protein n=1 Tax=Accumulibacter sp. TaxID=2053492 RepID=UPI0025D10829|nr:ATP-binding protein [Accumulibacter sp.]MCM8625371.1 ATP-binding protein [Accumulibacter sp.]
MFENLRKYAAAYAVAIGGTLLTCLSSWNVREELRINHLKEFRWAAGDRIQSVRAVVDQGLDALLEIRGLFHAAQEIDEQEFLAFTDSILKRRAYIDSLLWVPASAVALPAPGGRGPPGSKAPPQTPPAVPRADVLHASRAGAMILESLDLSATGELTALLARAKQLGNVAVSHRMTLDRPDGQAGHGVYAALPVYAANRSGEARAGADARTTGALLGYVVGLYDIEQLIHTAISLLEPRGVEVLIRDSSAEPDSQFLHFYASRLEPRTMSSVSPIVPETDDEPQMVVSIPVGDRTWTVICVATHTFRSAEAFTEAHWSVLLGGILCTSLLTFYLVRSRRELENRIRLTQTIYEREELFRQLAETVDVVFWAIDAQAARLEYIGPAFRQIAGPGVMLDSRNPSLMLEVFADDDRRTLVEAIAQLRAEGGRFSVVLKASSAERGLRWLRVCGFPVRETGNELSRIVGFFEDVTEHKLAEDALRDSEAKLRTLFNHSPDLIFTVDAEGDILLTNRPLPYPVGAPGNKRSDLILPPEVRPAYLEKLRDVFESGRVDHCQYTSSDATWWEIRMVPISSAETVIAAMVVITDITENRKLQWQAIRSARLASLGVLSAGIAHEINNPNHAILANSSLLARIWHDALPILDEYALEQGDFLLAGLGFAEAREVIGRGMQEIGENAKRIQKIVSNLKHLGKQDRGHMDEAADIGRILQAVVTLLDARIRKHTGAFSLKLPDQLPLVRGNVQQLEQVFINVIVNALEALPDRSRGVEVSACDDPAAGRIIVQVRDQGKGISEAAMAQIGEPFFTTKAETGGTGLGLSISSSIVERHGGALRFESSPTQGTTVSIDLPVSREE